MDLQIPQKAAVFLKGCAAKRHNIIIAMTTQHSPSADRAVVTWAGQGLPIVLTLHGPNGEATAVRLLPTRALELAKESIEPTVQSIKVQQWGEGWAG